MDIRKKKRNLNGENGRFEKSDYSKKSEKVNYKRVLVKVEPNLVNFIKVNRYNQSTV